MTEDPMAIMRGLEGRPAWTGDQSPRKKSGPRRGTRTSTPAPAKSKQPRASERASYLGQEWVDRGEARGLSFPYDVNYFALALQHKIERDPEMDPYLRTGKAEQVSRWVSKMIERWWEEYVDGTIHAGNAKDMFLGTDWDDLRYYAKSCLRAAYLAEHGRRISGPLYPNQPEYQDRLREVADKHQIDRLVVHADDETPTEDAPRLDENARQRLRSFVDKRRKK